MKKKRFDEDSIGLVALLSIFEGDFLRIIFTFGDYCVSLHFISVNKLKTEYIMNEFVKHLGIIIIILAAVVLILSHILGWNNINAVQFGSFGAMIVGLVLYIWLNKKA